ncbi:hypothetical protein [Phaffia rhodozyma]|uniref:Uncharacterized protein n=1 Tax=Phaffia rhodozyma TaxID=264483 RepID=A0A0F7SUP2_PHARH|nr:hypothetical protein [Phaffia rhodozyma]
MDEASQIQHFSSKRSSLPSFSSREIPSSPSVSVRRQSFQTQPSEAPLEKKKDGHSGLKRTWSMDSVKSDSEESTHPIGTPKREGFQMSNNAHPYQIVSSSSAVLSRGNPTPTKKSWVPTHRSSKSLSSMPSDPSYRPRPLPTPPHATLSPSSTTGVHPQLSPCPSDQVEKRGVRNLARKWEERGSNSSEASSVEQSETEETRVSDHSQSNREPRSLNEHIVPPNQPNRIFDLNGSPTSENEAYSLLPPSPPVSISSSSDFGSPPLVPTPPALINYSQPSKYSTLSRSTNRTRPKRPSESFVDRPCADSDGDSDEEDSRSRTFRRNVTARPSKILVTSHITGSIESKKDEADWMVQHSNAPGRETEYRYIIQSLTARIEALEVKLFDLERKSMVPLGSLDSELPPFSAAGHVVSSIPGSSTPSRAASSTRERSDGKRNRSVLAGSVPGYLFLVSIGVGIVTWEVLWRRFVRGRG